MKILLTKSSPGLNRLRGKFYKIFKEDLEAIDPKLLRIKNRNRSSNSKPLLKSQCYSNTQKI